MIEHIDADTLAIRIAGWKTVVLDVRAANAVETGGIPEAIRIPVDELATGVRGLPLETCLSIVCDIEEQASVAALKLWDCGYRKIAVLKGGFASYIERRLPLST